MSFKSSSQFVHVTLALDSPTNTSLNASLKAHKIASMHVQHHLDQAQTTSIQNKGVFSKKKITNSTIVLKYIYTFKFKL